MSDAVIELQQVTVESGHLYDTAIWQASLRLNRTELALIHLEEGHLRTPLADVAQGLVEPVQGSVRFLGEPWPALSHAARLAARGKIGRVFEEPGWINELDVDENITLAQYHHTQRSETAIRDEASALSRMFSLPGLPQGKASAMRAPDLRRAACVRAFLGEPQLLILERPTAGIYPGVMPALMTAVRAARARGAAILWTTDDWDVWNDPGINPTLRYKMAGSQLSVMPGG